jgi:hypothetical protein
MSPQPDESIPPHTPPALRDSLISSHLYIPRSFELGYLVWFANENFVPPYVRHARYMPSPCYPRFHRLNTVSDEQ